MKSTKNILIAFCLNLFFAVFEAIGGALSGSVAILSDAVHDFGDACSIGVSFFLEKKSKKQPDKEYSYGYARYSVLGSLFTTLVLLLGSCFVIVESVRRILNPESVQYDKMIVFAVIGVVVNGVATFVTHRAESVNQKAVSLHMLEDVLGWGVVLCGAIVMKLTDFALLDPILSVGVSLFILVSAIKNLLETLSLFLEKTPKNIDLDEIKKRLLAKPQVKDVHHVHVWTLDGTKNYCTLHVVTDGDAKEVKESVRAELNAQGIEHSTIETETESEICPEHECHAEEQPHHHHHH